mgnify:CR=1 FL=1|tara:strand:+ start:71 stop:490 length:420 start_codon:yes stop_codon:yes gene_type:complete
MGIDHGKKKNKKEVKVKTPLRKPKITQSAKTTVSDAQKKRQTGYYDSSKKTTVTDTQKRGQTGLRYDLFEGTKKPNIKFTYDDNPKYRAKPSPGSKGRKESRNKGSKKFQPDSKFLPHIIKPLYVLPEGKKKKKTGVMA